MKIINTELKTYTLNATPERGDVSRQENDARHNAYGLTVAATLSARDIDGFTLTEVKGYWQGEAEKSYIITVATDKGADVIKTVTDSLRARYNQDTVMLTYPDSRMAFVKA